MENSPSDHGGMVGRMRRAPRRASQTSTSLYLGQWIRALGFKPVDVVRATGINEGYLSELISGAKRNPSVTVLMEIADFLEIPMHYLRRPPPDQEFIQEAAALEPRVLERLRGSSSR